MISLSAFTFCLISPLRLALNPPNYQQREPIVSMTEILPLALNAHSANLLHWFHHVCQGFCPTFRPIWIKFEIIISLLTENLDETSKWSHQSSSSAVRSGIYCLSVSHTLERLWISWWQDAYLSFRWMIFLFPSMKGEWLLASVVDFDWILDSIFSYLYSF